jgi:hypothetical protein
METQLYSKNYGRRSWWKNVGSIILMEKEPNLHSVYQLVMSNLRSTEILMLTSCREAEKIEV